MKFIGRGATHFKRDIVMNGNTVNSLKAPVGGTEATDWTTTFNRIIFGPVASKPATLLPGQLWAGY